MDALIPALIAAGLAEGGGRMQLLAVALVRRFGRPGAVIAGLALAAAIVMALGVVAGSAIGREVPHSAARLLVGLALLVAGIGAVFRPKPAPDVATWRLGALLSSAGAAVILGFGEAAQFLAAALAAAGGEPVATGIGAGAGVTIACVPAVLLAERWAGAPAVRVARVVAGVTLSAAGVLVAVLALQIA